MPGIKKKKPTDIFPAFVDILGTPWQIIVRAYDEDPYFSKYEADGYCSNPEKMLVICDAATDPDKKAESDRFIIEAMKCSLRHEIVHAFFYESGLRSCASSFRGPWAQHEEMVDWVAQQTDKIHKAFVDSRCSGMPMSPEQFSAYVQYLKEKDTDNGRRE